MRLAKYLSQAGVASRRRSEQLIAEGRVTVDGEVVSDPACGVDAWMRVTVDGKPITTNNRQIVLMMNKPAGVISTASDTHGRRTVIDMARDLTDVRVYPVGRLDRDTTGLLLLTNDGELAYRLTHPRFKVEKRYIATVKNPPIDKRIIGRLEAGVELDDGMTAPAKVRLVDKRRLELRIHEGRKRQVRRMCEAVGFPLAALHRAAIGGLELGELKPGEICELSSGELEDLRRAVGL